LSGETAIRRQLRNAMKILIVDDEIVSLTKLKLIMAPFGQCQTAGNGRQALARFHDAHRNAEPFALIMLDINLPEMDGINVLVQIRQAEKDLNLPADQMAKILMATSHTDKNRIIASVQSGCNDYISKPFDPAVIHKKLARLGFRRQNLPSRTSVTKERPAITESQFIENIATVFDRRNIRLPALPGIESKFRQLIVQGAPFKKIAGLLKKDIAISVELIRMSNCVYYRGFLVNKALEQAISRLGFAAVEQIVAEMAGRRFYTMETPKYRCLLEKVWRHSIACAHAAEITATLLKLKLSVDPFSLGLLHDVGKIALLQIIAEMERRGKFNGQASTANLTATVDKYHCLFGARLLEKWKYTASYIQCALHHEKLSPDEENELQQDVSKELLLVHFANMLAKSLEYDRQPDDQTPVDLENTESADRLKINSSRIKTIKKKVTTAMNDTDGLL